MTSHHDVAARLRERATMLGPQPEQMLRFMNGMVPLLNEAIEVLEYQAKALSEAEAAIHAGHLMANILFNLSQRGEMNADLRKQMAECQKAFDTAAREFTNAAKEKT